MIIEEIKVKRFGGHEELSFKCDSPVVGVFGPNGSGKSTLLEALKFSITGETEENLNSYVKDLTGSGMVLTKFRKGGKKGSIERNIGTKTTRCLDWDEQHIKSAKQVSDTMREIFAADKKAIANAVFISQGTMSGILFCGNAERRDGFIELLNLSFCASRAELLMRKVQKLQSTMVDLTPSRDAALLQRDTAAQAYLDKKQILEGSYSWVKETAFLNETESARTERALFQTQIEQVATDHQLKTTEIASLLAQYGWPSLEAGETLLKTNTERLQQLVTKLSEINSVRAELLHYDRVDADIAVIYTEFASIQARVAAADPTSAGLLEWTKTKASLEQSEKQMLRRQSLLDQVTKWKGDKERWTAALPYRPVCDDKQLGILELELQEVSMSLATYKKLLAMREDIAACMAEGALVGKSICPKCNLRILDANLLSEEELARMRNMIQNLQTQLGQRERDYNAQKKAWNEYVAELAWKQKSIAGNQALIETAEAELANLPAFDAELIASEKARVADVIAVLQATAQEMMSAQSRFTAKVQERKGYLLANKYKKDRAAFSEDIVRDLTTKKTQMEQQNEIMQGYVQTLKQADLEVKRLEKAHTSLWQAIGQRDQILNKPDTEQLVALRLEIPDSGLLKAEINARAQNYAILQGQVKQLEETYASVNKAYQDIDDRMKKDEIKRGLIADLLKLKDLLSNDGLPLAYARLQFETLAQLTQGSLTKLDANFSIDVDRSRDLAFTFRRLDRDGGVELPMTSLSGGQKVRLCVSFLMAVQKHLVPEIGLLVLDEPTTSVDTEGRENIAQFLVGLGRELANTEMQIFVCDHSDEVRRELSCKIELAK